MQIKGNVKIIKGEKQKPNIHLVFKRLGLTFLVRRRAKESQEEEEEEEEGGGEVKKNQVCLCLVTIGNWILGLWQGE